MCKIRNVLLAIVVLAIVGLSSVQAQQLNASSDVRILLQENLNVFSEGNLDLILFPISSGTAQYVITQNGSVGQVGSSPADRVILNDYPRFRVEAAAGSVIQVLLNAQDLDVAGDAQIMLRNFDAPTTINMPAGSGEQVANFGVGVELEFGAGAVPNTYTHPNYIQVTVAYQ